MASAINSHNHIGPLIALLTEVKETDKPDFGNVHAFCEELHQGISELGGRFFVFSLDGFDEEGITGYYYENDEWKKGVLPLPQVIYNRLSSRRTEFGNRYNAFLENLNTSGIKIFNHRFLSKWEIHETLSAEQHLRPFLPETRLYNRDALKEMLEHHDLLYIKPVHGSQGRRIIRLSRLEGNVHVSFSSFPEKEMPAFRDVENLARSLASKAEKQQCIIQQGIHLSDFNGRKMDFRVLCHKNAQHFWKTTSVVARVSAEDCFVSNIARGGEAIRPLQVLSGIFGKEQAHQQVALMKELAIEVADAIGRYSQGHTAELGIDIGIDVSGKLWLIEANSKPSKNFEERGERIRPSTKAIIEHCFGLSGAGGAGGENK